MAYLVVLLAILLLPLKPTYLNAMEEIDFSDRISSGFKIRCSERGTYSIQGLEGVDYIDFIEIMYAGTILSDYDNVLSVNVYRADFDAPHKYDDSGIAYYTLKRNRGGSEVSVEAFGYPQDSSYKIIIRVDASGQGDLYQYINATKDAGVTLGEWRISNFTFPFGNHELQVKQNSVSIWKERIVDTIDKTWNQCVYIDSDGSISDPKYWFTN